MATARSRRWVKLVAGLLLGSAVECMGGGGTYVRAADPTPPLLQPAQTLSASAALRQAAELQRQGRYEDAATYLRQANGRARELTLAEGQELARLWHENFGALQQRRAAIDLLLQAEQEKNVGRTAEAAQCLEQLAAVEGYLAPRDRERLQALRQVGEPSVVRAAAAEMAGPAQAAAMGKLKLARKELGEYRFDEAEKLAREAEGLNATWGQDDSPRKVLEEVARLRTDGKSLLAGARHWLARKDYDRAEKLALAAEKHGSGWNLNPFGDTPMKALKEIQTARAKDGSIQQVTARVPSGATGDVRPAVATAMDQPKPVDRKADDARRLVGQGRKALQTGDAATAKAMAEQARALGGDLAWWEDTPDKLLADAARAARPTVTPAKTKDEAVAQLKRGRALYAEGKIDEALEIASSLKAQSNLSWGLFEATPDGLLRDAEAAKTKRDQANAGRVLAEGRQLLARGDLDGAARAAEQAQKLHGPYSAFDFGDRPTKLLAEVATARQKQRATGGTQFAQNGPATASPATQCQILINDARAALKAGDPAKATRLAEQAKLLKERHNLTPSDSPEVILAEAQRAVGLKPGGATVGATGDPAQKKQQANALLATARQLQQQGKLVEAREKAVEAQRVGATYGPTEDTPDVCVQQLNDRAARTIAGLVNSVADTLANGKGSAAEIAKSAEEPLVEARRLAVAFGQDLQPIDIQMAAIAKLKGVDVAAAPTPPTTGALPPTAALPPTGALPPETGALPPTTGALPPEVPGTTPAPTAPANNPGRLLVDGARVELRKGELSTARKMAEEAAQGAYGVQDEALAVLRTIEAEEARQRGLNANRTFDAARQAFQRGDHTHAANLIAEIGDVRQLDPSRQGQLREMMMTPQMQPSAIARTTPTPGVSPIPTTAPGTGTQTVRHDEMGNPLPVPPVPGTPTEAPGTVRVTDQPGTQEPGQLTLERAAAMREVKFQKLRDQGLKTQSEATEKFRTGQYDLALEMLQNYLQLLDSSELEANQTSLLRRSTESRLQQFRVLKSQQELASRHTTAKENAHAKVGQRQMAELHKQKSIDELMKQSTALLKEGKYLEAERTAMQAHELDPDNAVVSAMVFIAKRQRRGEEYQDIKNAKEELVLTALHNAEKQGPASAINNIVAFDKDRSAIAQKRTGRGSSKLLTKSPREREIEQKLNTPVTLSFKDVPLYHVLQSLSVEHNVPIWPNRAALEADGINLDRPVSIQIGNLSLRSALNLLLKDAHLTWVIRDEVLQVTTPTDARGKLETRVLDVGDLVVPIHEFGKLNPAQAQPAALTPLNPLPGTGPQGASPVTTPFSLLNGENVGQAGGVLQTNTGQQQWTQGKSPTQHKELIQLILNTVNPSSWREMGGQGTIEFLPLNNGLVVNQTTDIQEQIADLLAALRRLNDQEVAVEVRFITITEDFYERIGVNFNVNIVNDQAQRFAPQLQNGVGTPSPQFNVFNPNGLVAGITPAGTFTNDLSIPITNQTFWQTIPAFGGYPGVGIGGVTMGLAFLSDIQVFLFLEAVQGDVRNNIMQAPKLTLFNGQTANLSVGENRLFVTGTGVALINGNPVFQPQINQLNINTTLTIQAVITADRRFVRMSIQPFLNNQLPGPVASFPVVVPIFPQQGIGVFSSPPDPIVFTQLIQQPGTSFVTVGTTVMVPDGGTVLMGGLKRLSENRTEFGAPILSKIPAINRLFRNVGYGREASSLLLMVTPRIIIQEEEEERATGYRDRPLIGTGGE